MTKLLKKIYKYEQRWFDAGLTPKRSYSQCGEDLLIDFFLSANGIKFPTYLDLGAHHPRYLNNTYIFYCRGCKGINVEANPELMKLFHSKRRRDVNLNVGVANTDHSEGIDFYVMTASTMSTFSKEEAERVHAESSIKIDHVIKIPTMTLSNMLAKHWDGAFPDILTCDVEGLDDMIIDDLYNFPKNALPKVICLETVTFREGGFGPKKQGLIQKVIDLGYTVHADTYINTIFARADLAR